MKRVEASDETQATAFVPLSAPHFRGNEWAYVKECLDTEWVSSVGAYVDRFERELAERVEMPHGVATANGTSALHIALKVAGVEPGDEVPVSSLTFIAPINAIRYLGAVPVFLDSEEATWQMDPEALRAYLEGCDRDEGAVRNRATGRRVRALVPVHILGNPVRMEPVMELAERYGLPVIEDATESLGATYGGRPVGSWGAMSCFSFNGNKLLTCGGGGALLARDEAQACRAKHLTTQAKADPLEYVHDEVGYNYRLTNLQAALACAQLEQIETFLERKRRIAARYREAIRDLPGVQAMPETENARSAWWLFTIRLGEEARLGSRELVASLSARGLQSRPLWQPNHLSPAHRDVVPEGLRLPVSEALFDRCVSLPCSVGLSESDQDRVIEALFELLR